jgi:hypothetical protein
MGLAERRATKAFIDNMFPSYRKQIQDLVGFEVPIEVQWTFLAVDDKAPTYEDDWPKMYFRPLLEALRAVTSDDIGKEGLQQELKRIIIQNSTGNYSCDRWASFRNGVLTLDHDPHTNVDYVEDRRIAIINALEQRDQSKLGLAERRACKAFEEQAYPPLKKQIDEAAGFEVPVEVRWGLLASKDYADSYSESWPKVFFKPLIEALKRISNDAMGKEALKTGLKRIIVQNSCGNYSADRWATFRDGTLFLDHDPVSNQDYGEERWQRLHHVLEKGL